MKPSKLLVCFYVIPHLLCLICVPVHTCARVGRMPGCPGIPRSIQALSVLGSVLRFPRSEVLTPRKWPAARLFLISAVPCPVGADLFGLWKQAESHPHSSRSFGLALARGGPGLEITISRCAVILSG